MSVLFPERPIQFGENRQNVQNSPQQNLIKTELVVPKTSLEIQMGKMTLNWAKTFTDALIFKRVFSSRCWINFQLEVNLEDKQ